MLECDENVKEKRGKKHNRRSACRLPPCRSHMPHGHVAAVQQTAEASRAICMPWPWSQAKRTRLSPPRLFGAFWHLLAPVGSSATGAARMIHNRQAANIQRQTQNACQCRHLRGSCNHTAAHTPPVSHCAERLFRFHKRPSSPSARLASARRRSCTCKPHANASACKAAITAIKAFQATGTVAREGRHSARLSATMAGL